MPNFLGIDVGSVTTKVVLIDHQQEILFDTYLRTEGGPIHAIQRAFTQLCETAGEVKVAGVGTTGSGRRLAGIMTGADIIKNEITAHAVAARWVEPKVATVIDIGGQDSKIIFFQNGVPIGFNMNTVCAAGTGSFLDHQAVRLGIPIEEFGEYALRSGNPIKIAGRCGVFAESDLIHKQQLGYQKEDLIAGLCMALAGNYLANVARGRHIEPVVLFQGGVAANIGMRAAFENRLGIDIVVPTHFKVMGALGAALLAKRNYERRRNPSNFRGAAHIASFHCAPRTFICGDCPNNCEVNEVYIGGELVSRWASRCGKWHNLNLTSSDRSENRWGSGLKSNQNL
ncbi:MAG: acyl-CoA dehydratase activase [Bacillota bacterium]